MGDWSLLGDNQRFANIGADPATSRGVLVDAHASNHTKGSYYELIAATPFDGKAFIVNLYAATDNAYLLDIAVGAVGSEAVIIPNIYVDNPSTTGIVQLFPVAIPAGSRIATRVQCTAGGSQIRVSGTLIGGGLAAPGALGRVVAYGVNTATTLGTVIDPGGTINTKGAYAQLTAGTAAPTREIVLAFGRNLNTALAIAPWLVDVSIGAAGSEQVVIPNMQVVAALGNAAIKPYILGPLPLSIPTATRIAVRAQCGINDATDRKFTVAIYGID